MKIKHWQGYGTVDAVKKSKRKIEYDFEKCNEIIIEVVGNHEYGLYRDDKYDIFNWLLKRFDKTAKDYWCIRDMKIESGYRRNNDKHIDEECCVYKIIYEV